MIYSLYADAAGATSLTFREDDQIVGISIETLNSASASEHDLSFLQNGSNQVNDQANSLWRSKIPANGTKSLFIDLASAPVTVQGGERVYLHMTQDADAYVTIYTKKGTKLNATTRR